MKPRLLRLTRIVSAAAIAMLILASIGIQGSLDCERITLGQALAWQGGLAIAAAAAYAAGKIAEVLS